jgi:translation initiation factor 2 subunit 1
MSSNAPDGILQIKKALAAGLNASSVAEIKMTYVGAPRYRVRVTADDYKQADKVMGAVLLKMEEAIGKHGSFSSKKEMSRKYGGA